MISYLLMTMLQRSPLLLVISGGIIFALVRWRRHPKISFLTILGLVIYVVRLFCFSALSYSIPRMRESMHWSYADAVRAFFVLDLLNSVVLAGLFILFVTLAFAQRHSASGSDKGSVRSYQG